MVTNLKHLQDLLEFTDTDLTANRRGRLSHDQIDYLKRKASHERNAVLLIPSAILIGMLTMTNFWVALPAILISLVILAGLISLHEQRLGEIKDQHVVQVSGSLSKVPHSHTVTHFAIVVNDERFPVDRDFYYQISEGEYTLYLLEETREILAVEPGKKRTSSASNSKAKSTAKKSTAKSKTSQSKSASRSKSKTSARKTTAKSTSDKPARPRYSSRSKSA